jgi:hypothetical protein
MLATEQFYLNTNKDPGSLNANQTIMRQLIQLGVIMLICSFSVNSQTLCALWMNDTADLYSFGPIVNGTLQTQVPLPSLTQFGLSISAGAQYGTVRK